MLFIRGMVDIISFSELKKSRLMLYKTNNECFASLNRTFHLSPHENICTIALITIHYLYNNTCIWISNHATSIISMVSKQFRKVSVC